MSLIGKVVLAAVFCGGLFVLSAQNNGAGSRDDVNNAARANDAGPANLVKAEAILPIDPKPLKQDPDWPTISGRTTVNWKGLLGQSAFFLGLQHAFRLGTEPGTREGLKGPFFDNYARSVGNLHGWADGDEFYVNYIGHPMQGSVAGFIFAQNDKARFRYVEFGKDRNYWKGRLRSFAYSAAYSAQFEVGPLSEASIGAIQSRFPQQGLVDLITTPALGLGWMIAEDALDRYITKPFEQRFDSPIISILLRSWLSPTRSFANALALKVPWHRDTRPGVYGAKPKDEGAMRFMARSKGQKHEQNPRWTKEAEAVVSPFEFDLNFQPTYYLGGEGISCIGGGGTGAFRLASRWQAVMDIGGCNLMGLPQNWSGDSLHYLGGIRWTPWAANRWSSHVQILAGGNKITEEVMFPQKKQALYQQWTAAGSVPEDKPAHEQYTVGSETNKFALETGAGLSYRMNSAIQWKLATVEYRHAWLPLVNGRNYRSSLSLTTGIALRMGSW